jgi:hypothetical protein
MAVRAAPPAGSLRMAVSGVMPGGSAWANVFWTTTIVGTPTTTQMNTVAQDLLALWVTNFQSRLADDVTITLGKATYYGASGYVITGEHAISSVGTYGSNSQVPDQAAAVLSWLVSTTWRGGKPRTYLPAVPNHAVLVDMAHLSSTVVSGLEGDGAAFLAAINGYNTSPFTTMVLGCLRFFSAGAPLGTPIFLPFTGCTVHSRVATIRRRLGRET